LRNTRGSSQYGGSTNEQLFIPSDKNIFGLFGAANGSAQDYTVLLKALPPAWNKKESKLLQKFIGFIASTEIQEYIKKFYNIRYQTREILLQSILQYLQISEDVMLKPEVYNCIRYYVVKTYLKVCPIYRMSIKSFPDYKYLLQENYLEYKHIFFSKCNSTQEVFLRHISTFQHVFLSYST
jgi:hypothetical protein